MKVPFISNWIRYRKNRKLLSNPIRVKELDPGKSITFILPLNIVKDPIYVIPEWKKQYDVEDSIFPTYTHIIWVKELTPGKSITIHLPMNVWRGGICVAIQPSKEYEKNDK